MGKRVEATGGSADHLSCQEVYVLLTGRAADREAVARGIELAQANKARLQIALLASPIGASFGRYGYARAGLRPECMETDRELILRRALAEIPGSLPVTTRRLN